VLIKLSCQLSDTFYGLLVLLYHRHRDSEAVCVLYLLLKLVQTTLDANENSGQLGLRVLLWLRVMFAYNWL